MGAIGVEYLIGAVEHDAFEQDAAVGVIGGDEGAAACELKRRGACGSDDARPGRKLQRADAIAAGGQLEGSAAACGFIDRRLQYRRLLDGAARREAEVGPGSQAHPRLGRARTRPRGTCHKGGGDTGGKYTRRSSVIAKPREQSLGDKQV